MVVVVIGGDHPRLVARRQEGTFPFVIPDGELASRSGTHKARTGSRLSLSLGRDDSFYLLNEMPGAKAGHFAESIEERVYGQECCSPSLPV
jgi:hypothetical protein